MNQGVTFGAVFAGILLLGIEVRAQKPSIARLKNKPLDFALDMLPFLLAWCIGALTVMVGGGLIGWWGDFALWGIGTVGDWVLVAGVGVDGGTAPGSSSQPLNKGGTMAALLLVCWLWPRGKSQWLGWLSGVGMCLSAGVAKYAAIPLASGVNTLGGWLFGLIAGVF